MPDASNPKAQAREAIDRLPETATWGEVLFDLHMRLAIEVGLDDVAAGRTVPSEQVRARLKELMRHAS
jgi:predicted transcriptional regulator